MKSIIVIIIIAILCGFIYFGPTGMKDKFDDLSNKITNISEDIKNNSIGDSIMNKTKTVKRLK